MSMSSWVRQSVDFLLSSLQYLKSNFSSNYCYSRYASWVYSLIHRWARWKRVGFIFSPRVLVRECRRNWQDWNLNSVSRQRFRNGPCWQYPGHCLDVVLFCRCYAYNASIQASVCTTWPSRSRSTAVWKFIWALLPISKPDQRFTSNSHAGMIVQQIKHSQFDLSQATLIEQKAHACIFVI